MKAAQRSPSNSSAPKLTLVRLLLAACQGGAIPLVPFAPIDDSWINPSTPLLSPVQPWEQTATYEPSLVREDDGSLTMLASAGWADPAIGRWTLPAGDDPTVTVNWDPDPDNPILGQGGGGVTGMAVRHSFIKVGSTYYVFWVDANPNANLRVSSTDDFDNWTHHGIILADDAASWATGWANSTVWKEGSTWFMLVEGRSGSIWEIALLSSASLTSGWAFLNDGDQLTDLQVAAGGMYGGPHIIKRGGTLHLWYHAAPGAGSLPTNIYYSQSPSSDKINWTTPVLVLEHSGSGFQVDQVADPCVIVVGGVSYLFFDGDDNVSEAADIGVAVAS